ncbi:expressed unknown protein [Seminavis robusta]|uniref:HSF-type DNA-binding domain-containing protein n=1 Tax=Seminavis robusta TaxID=568900 RepID=A0A9N8EBB1_9STRA|nr:expressed unknown protein [Seminavis robusta]|eukprot:Sro896_g217320.1 n/a (477) ;mRNA; r:14427-16078
MMDGSQEASRRDEEDKEEEIKQDDKSDKSKAKKPASAKRQSSSEDEEQPPEKKAKKRSDDDAEDAKPAAAKKKSSAPSVGTYPKPKNFAERMMNVLENNVDPKVVKWHGEEDLIAINTKSLKTSEILDDRFQGIRYAAFIRNLSRWGFRKVPKLEAEDGVVVYRNSLFQRENPHLVRHMKIDSDVQDIFGQHQRSSYQRASAAVPQPPQPPAAPPQPQAGGLVLQGDSLNLLAQLITQQNQPQQRHAPQANHALESQLQSLQAALSGQVVPAPTRRTPQVILEEIVGLSKEYLEAVPSTAGNPGEESINALLTLVVGLGTEQIRAREPEGMSPPGSMDAPAPQPQQVSSSNPLLQELLLSVGQSQNQQPPPAAAAAPPPPPVFPGAGVGSSDSVLRQLQQQQQQQNRAALPAHLLGPQADIQSILAQAAGISSLNGAPLSPQLLLQLQHQHQQQQQQQNQGNPNLPSPPGDNCRQS